MPTFKIPDMSCAHCVKAISEAVHALDADAKVETDLEKKSVTIDSHVSSAALAQALSQAGYPPS